MTSYLGDAHRDIMTDFITTYKNESCLWQFNSKDYHNKAKRNVAYQKLIEILQQIDPKADRERVVKKINSLRTNHRKERIKLMNSQRTALDEDDIYKTNLWYYHLFDFLSELYKPRQDLVPLSNFNDDNEKDHSAFSDKPSDEDDPFGDDSQPPTAFASVEITPYTELPTNISIEYPSTPISPIEYRASKVLQRPAAMKRIKPAELTPTTITSQTTTITTNSTIEDELKKLQKTLEESLNQGQNEENEYDTFGKTIAKHLKKLPESLALESMSHIQGYLIEQRLKTVKRPYMDDMMEPRLKTVKRSYEDD